MRRRPGGGGAGRGAQRRVCAAANTAAAAPRARRHLGAQGATVVLLDMLQDKLEAAVGTLTAAGVEASSHAINVTVVEDWERAVAAVLAARGRIDILVQAAGITGKTGVKAHEVDPANFDLVMSVNARGIFLGCRAVLPAMVAAGYGRILNVASVAGKEGNAGMTPYSASKGAVIAMTKAMGKEYAEAGITINALAPAVVRTAMVAAMPEEQVKYMTGACARLGPPAPAPAPARWGPVGRRCVAGWRRGAEARARALCAHSRQSRPVCVRRCRQDPHEAVRPALGDLGHCGVRRVQGGVLHHGLHVRRHRRAGDRLSSSRSQRASPCTPRP